MYLNSFLKENWDSSPQCQRDFTDRVQGSGNQGSTRTILTALNIYWTTEEEGRETLLSANTDPHQLPWYLLFMLQRKVSCYLSSYLRWKVTQQRWTIKAWRGCCELQLCSWQSASTLIGKDHFPEGNQLSLIFVRGTSGRSDQGSVLDYH